jgi:8-oxo-dGTP diphosphatase
MLTQIAVVLLVDRSGGLLLQLRDDEAPNWPGLWGLPGGHVEPGETVIEAAARELFEESALRVDGPLTLFDRQEMAGYGREKSYFYAATSATQADVVLGEGAAIVFTPRTDLLDGREYTPGTEEMLTRFLASPAYADLVGFTSKG